MPARRPLASSRFSTNTVPFRGSVRGSPDDRFWPVIIVSIEGHDANIYDRRESAENIVGRREQVAAREPMIKSLQLLLSVHGDKFEKVRRFVAMMLNLPVLGVVCEPSTARAKNFKSFNNVDTRRCRPLDFRTNRVYLFRRTERIRVSPAMPRNSTKSQSATPCASSSGSWTTSCRRRRTTSETASETR